MRDLSKNGPDLHPARRLLPLPPYTSPIPLSSASSQDPDQRPPRLHHWWIQRHRAGIRPPSCVFRSMPKLRDAKKAIRKGTVVDVTVYSADVRDMEAVRSAIDAAGIIDVLICNQGVFTPRELLNVDMEEVKFTLDVNVVGTIHLIKAALPKMKAAVSGLPRSIGIMSSQAGQVGIYGYTAYSASKFALRGLAESLQQEVISDNIHISLIFPPDTETPGLIEEQKTRPEITNILAGSSGGLKAEDVAEKALAGIQSGNFMVSCNFLGHMLSVSTAGLSPQRSYIMAFIEVFSIGLMRFIGLCFQWNWYGVISKYHKEQVNDSPPGTKVWIPRSMLNNFSSPS